jgi:hypothetical protein
LLPNTDIGRALRIGETARMAVQALAMPHCHQQPSNHYRQRRGRLHPTQWRAAAGRSDRCGRCRALRRQASRPQRGGRARLCAADGWRRPDRAGELAALTRLVAGR